MGSLETIISVDTELWQECYNWLELPSFVPKDHYYWRHFDLCESTPEINRTDTCNESHLGSQHSNELIPQTLSGHALPEHTQFIMYLENADNMAGCSRLVACKQQRFIVGGPS